MISILFVHLCGNDVSVSKSSVVRALVQDHGVLHVVSLSKKNVVFGCKKMSNSSTF